MQQIISEIKSISPLLVRGACMTLALWISASAISLSVGMLSGILRSKKMYTPFISQLLDIITFIGRGIPFYVQLLIAYFVIPAILKINIPTFILAATSLGICSASYASQTVKGAINALPSGQWQAAQALGFSRWQTIRFIILPQAMTALLPALTSELDQTLKSTSIFASIGVLELTRASMNIISRTMNPVPVYLSIAVIYLLMSSILNIIGAYLEKQRRIPL